MTETSSPRLLATPGVIDAVAGSSAAVVMIGGFDGGDNFGDVAQFLEGCRMVRGIGTTVPILAIVEHSYVRVLDELRRLSPELAEAHYLFFDDGSSGTGDTGPDLVPVQHLPGRVLFFFSGGGYANRRWGRRKAAMHMTARHLIRGDDVYVRVVASGIQIDDDGAIELPHLGAAEIVGTRDAKSFAVAGRVAGERATFSGDDALTLLLRSAERTRRSSEIASGAVNLHVSTESYVTDDSAKRLHTVIDLLAEFASKQPITTINLIVAFGDQRISERETAGRLANELSRVRGLEGATFRTVELTNRLCAGEQLLPAAEYCISSSYHVALTSIVAEVPTVLIWSGDYYREKASGLADLFNLPSELLMADGADPSAAVDRCVAISRTTEAGASYAAGVRRGLIASLAGHIEVERAIARQILALDGGAGWEQAARLGREYGEAVHEVADLRLRVNELTRARRALANRVD